MGQLQNLGLNIDLSCHANIFVNLNKKNYTSTTPLNCLLKSIIFELKAQIVALINSLAKLYKVV